MSAERPPLRIEPGETWDEAVARQSEAAPEPLTPPRDAQ